ncbi:hypothetical protein [Leptospira stimsonii]|uniref:Uncharacterized protein n=1 Tax=Leptospira stimsonii TaxID=2202203 RepID=A0A396YNC1_9LEPT|nr:hypothetical protein [Leptospira stimsonii]RHX84692.1 hypothetical protein DLM75_21980 [Leptospira stimsonii]
MDIEKEQKVILNLGTWSVGRIAVVFILGFILIANLDLEKHKLLYIILGMSLLLEAFTITQNNLSGTLSPDLSKGMRYALLFIMFMLGFGLILFTGWIAYLVSDDLIDACIVCWNSL